MADTTAISKTLSYWLRHAPQEGHLTLDGHGWAEADHVLAALRLRWPELAFEDLQLVVDTSDKKRFELSPDLGRIRARQGHSVAVDLELAPVAPPETLFHGTSERFIHAIEREGLLAMARHHVHLSADRDTAWRVATRRALPVVLEVAAGRMHEAGHPFFLTANGVWLVGHVPSVYLARPTAE